MKNSSKSINQENYLFLKTLYGENPEQAVINLFTLPGSRTYSFCIDDSNSIVSKIEDLRDDYNVYYEVCLKRNDPEIGSRGKEKEALVMPGLWFDLDIAEGSHKQKSLPTQQEAIQFINELPHSPTMIVDSGGGFHLYFLFNEPWVFADDNERERGKKFSKAFQQYIIKMGQKHGWKLDDTSDLARILRVPETYNYKTNPPNVVSILYLEEEIRYDREELIEYYCKQNDENTTKIKSKIKTNKDGNTFKWQQHDFPPADLTTIEKECAWMKHCKEDAETLSEPEWLANLSIIGRCTDGDILAHRWSKPYPGYTYEETEKKLMHSMKAGPRTCENICNDLNGEEYCKNCYHNGKISSPITLGSSEYNEKKPDTTKRFEYSDMGNGERFAYLHKRDLRFDVGRGKWLVWNGQFWEYDKKGLVRAKAKETIISMCDGLIYSSDTKKVFDFMVKSQSRKKVDDMIKNASEEEGIPIVSDDLDQNEWLLNCQNGTIDLKTGKLKRHIRSDLITKMIPVTYDSNADCSRFKKFILEIMDGKQEMADYLQRFFGYALTGSTKERCFVFFIGKGANGKSILLETIRVLMGPFARQASFDTFIIQGGNRIREDVARLQGSRFVTAVESNKGIKLDEALIKQLTGGDKISARFLRRNSFEFTPQFKIVLASNYLPKIVGKDDGIWDRIHLIPFNVRFEGKNRDDELLDKLKKELPGILNWAIEGCLEWQRIGLNPPDEVIKATEKYRDKKDIIDQYLEERIISSHGCRINKTELHKDYYNWCYRNGYKVMAQRSFSMEVKDKGYIDKKSNLWYWKDIAFVE